MAGERPSPRRYSSHGRNVSFREDSHLSTRGQHLPSLIQSQFANTHDGRRGSDPDLERGEITFNPTRWYSPATQRQINVSSDGRGLDLDDEGFAPLSAGLPHADFGDEPPTPTPPVNFPLSRVTSTHEDFERRASVLFNPQMRSHRLIGNSNPRYRWAQYYKTDDQLKLMPKKLRGYHERNNFLIMQYDYIDRLLDSSVPHDLIQEYDGRSQAANGVSVPPTIQEHAEEMLGGSPQHNSPGAGTPEMENPPKGVKRTKDLYRVPEAADENTPLLNSQSRSSGKSNRNDTDADDEDEASPSETDEPKLPEYTLEEDEDSGAPIVTVAINVNLAANTVLLILKIIVTVLTSSLSVLASLVDAALDFLSTAIVWTTTRLISAGARDRQNFPVGRQRLEPIGVLVFAVVMITSFVQVALEAIQRLSGPNRDIVELSTPALLIMGGTVVVKAACWVWCRAISNSSVQALAQDAVTDVVFNFFSIVFPLLGFYLRIWWLDPLGGLCLSLYVILSWSLTVRTHVLNLTGQAASADQRNILLYLTMRFAHTIRRIQNLSAYHAGDKLIVEVDIVLDEGMSLRDSHDLGESLQYVLESVPGVERAFVHADYWEGNLPSHMGA